ncbi:roundabout homolog 3-like [Hyposmocoma kahamanoa]|uniref:roundabout homolog 3-like n=1 Tax=Hyposmocoma kahamanoa TaxID=1477025 RepID=UPI000E6D78FC|nr:roundabout homolog 3-like [Hyposmocoma kahamanoa]XP_026324601.1 roundabout homolog 3-like [Hyposmocoma kahamanoa]
MYTLHLLVILLSQTVLSEKLMSEFKGVTVKVKNYENDTVILPCTVIDTDQLLHVKWYKETTLLGDSSDPHHLLPPRFRMNTDYSLQISPLMAEDTANYFCEVIRKAPWSPITQGHFVDVLTSPTIRTVPADGFVEVRVGEFVNIGCETSGNPDPVVTWRKNGEEMPLLSHRDRFKFQAGNRHMGGVYECVADNGVGDPGRGLIRVVIQDAPEVSAERSFVHTAVGLRATLTARLEFSAPPARTSWFRNGQRIKTDERIAIMVKDDQHLLIFREVRPSDFGNYTFRAENSLGMADVSFKLTGVPNAASFKVDPALNRATGTSYTLIWEVDSYSAIIEYNLWIRPYYGHRDDETTEASSNQWRKIVVPGENIDGPIHSAWYTLRGLAPSTVYEAVVTSRNRFGWSKQSAVLHFATEPLSVKRPSTDYSEITPILEDPEVTEAHNITQAQMFEVSLSAGARETPIQLAAILVLASLLLI